MGYGEGVDSSVVGRFGDGDDGVWEVCWVIETGMQPIERGSKTKELVG